MELSDIEKAMNLISEIEFKTVGLYQHWAEKRGISFELMILLYSLVANDNITQKKIATTYRMPKQTVFSLVRNLQNQGFVELIQSETDKREKVIHLTHEGESYCFEVIRPLTEINKNVGKRIGLDFTCKLLEDLKVYCRSIEMAMELAEVSDKWENMIEHIQTD